MMAQRTTRNSVAAASDASRDIGRVSGEVGQPGPQQTAAVGTLPHEVLSEIIEIVARKGVKTKDLENLLRSCRAIYCAGLPRLFREVTLDSKTGVEKLRALAGGPTGIDCTSFVRVLRIPAGLSWSKGNLTILAKCFRNVRRVSFTARGSKVLATIWNLIKDAPILDRLELDLDGDVFGSFDDQTIFPASVRVLHLDICVSPKRADPFIQMLDMRAPNLVEIRLGDGGHVDADRFHDLYAGLYPSFASKVWGIRARPEELLVVHKTEVDLIVWPWSWSVVGSVPIAWRNPEKLDCLSSLTTYHIATKEFLQFDGMFSKLTKLVFQYPQWNLAPVEFELAAAAICRPRVEVIFELTRGQRGEEWNFWMSHLGITIVFRDS